MLLKLFNISHHVPPHSTSPAVKRKSASHFQADIILCTLLSFLTFGFVAVSMFGMFYLTTSHQEPEHSQIPKYWTDTAVGVFLGIAVSACWGGNLDQNDKPLRVMNILITSKASLRDDTRWAFCSLLFNRMTPYGVKSMDRWHEWGKEILLFCRVEKAQL